MINNQANFFEIFGINIEFDVDKNKISDEYLLLQKQYHPDKATSTKEQVMFSEFSAYCNKALKTLESDVERAIYILKLNNIELEDYANEKHILESVWLDYEKFEEMHSIEELQSFYQDKIQERKELLTKLITLFKTNIVEAGKYTMLLKYLSNLIHNIKSKIDQLKI